MLNFLHAQWFPWTSSLTGCLWRWRWCSWSPQGLHQLGRRSTQGLHLLWTQISIGPKGCCCRTLVLYHPTKYTCSLEANRDPLNILKFMWIFQNSSKQRWWEAGFWFRDSLSTSFRTETSYPSSLCTNCLFHINSSIVSVSYQVAAFSHNGDNREEKTGMPDKSWVQQQSLKMRKEESSGWSTSRH